MQNDSNNGGSNGWDQNSLEYKDRRYTGHGYFDGTFPQCQKYVKEHFRNKKVPVSPNGTVQYYESPRFLVLVTASL